MFLVGGSDHLGPVLLLSLVDERNDHQINDMKILVTQSVEVSTEWWGRKADWGGLREKQREEVWRASTDHCPEEFCYEGEQGKGQKLVGEEGSREVS